MYKQIIGLACLLFITHVAIAGNIYKWNENGRTVFGQFPPTGVTSTPVSVSKRASASRKEPKTPEQRLDQSENKEKSEQVLKEMTQEQEKYVKARELNCQKARHNLIMLKSGGHHRVQLPDGSIKYLDEVETASKVSTAKKDISELCDKS